MAVDGKRRTAFILGGVVVGMLALSAASVPLYAMFCRATGFGGTPRVASAPATTVSDATVLVQFDAATDPKLPWSFHPTQRSMVVPLGEQMLAVYTAENHSDRPIVGRAVFNVTPLKIGGYFAKLACFCFEEQTLEPGQKVDMPVSFFVDPAMLEGDADVAAVKEITLSYTFYMDEAATAELAKKRGLGPVS
jgi:cytochrome c oxidase assembly protein subunit 11